MKNLVWGFPNAAYKTDSVLDPIPTGRIVFGGITGAIATSANLVWDLSTQRVGIGIAAPSAKLEVFGDVMFRAPGSANNWMITSSNENRYLSIRNFGNPSATNFGIAKQYFINGCIYYNVDSWDNRSDDEYKIVTKPNPTAMGLMLHFYGYGGNAGFHWYAPDDNTSNDSYNRMVLRNTGELSIGVLGGKGGSIIVKGKTNDGSTQTLTVQNSSGGNSLRVLSNNNAVIGGSLYVNSSVTTINASAAFQVDSTTQGLLLPRMTTAQRTAIASPAAGLMVYDTDTNKSYTWDGSTWSAHY